jgi:hypothetical protein
MALPGAIKKISLCPEKLAAINTPIYTSLVTLRKNFV